MRTNAPWLHGVLWCWVIGSFVGGFALAAGPRVIYSTIAGSATSTVPEPNSVRKFHWIDRPWCGPDGNYFALTADDGADPSVDPNVDQFIIVGTTALDGNTVDARVVVREANLITGGIHNGPMHGRVCIRDDGQFMYTTNSDANQLNDEMIGLGTSMAARLTQAIRTRAKCSSGTDRTWRRASYCEPARRSKSSLTPFRPAARSSTRSMTTRPSSHPARPSTVPCCSSPCSFAISTETDWDRRYSAIALVRATEIQMVRWVRTTST